MFGTIRKHQTWLWVVIIAVIIVSFVVYFSPYQQMNQDVRLGNLGSIGGKKITEKAFDQAQREMYLRFFMMSGKWPDQESQRMGFDLERETYQWLFLKHKMKEMGIAPSDKQVEQQARQMLTQFKQLGIDSAQVLFRQVLQPRGLLPEDFERFVRNSLAIQELVSLVGSSGKLVSDSEIKSRYEKENTPVSTDLVVFNATNYLTEVRETPEAIAQHYTNYSANYRVPDRIQVSYVAFYASNYLAKVQAALTNLDDVVQANQTQMGTNLFGDAKTLDESKANIRKELMNREALVEARKAAADFSRPLLEQEKIQVGDLEKLAKDKGLTVGVTAPFSRETGPAEIDAGPDFVRSAFLLKPEEPIARPQVGDGAVYIIAYNKVIPSELPPLDQIRARVTADYRNLQALNLARQTGEQFQTKATNAVAQGKAFDVVAKESLLKVISLEPFSRSTRVVTNAEPHLSMNQLTAMAFSVKPGQVTAFSPTEEGGAVLFVKAALPLDTVKMQTELPAFANAMRRMRQEEAFNEWFRREAESGLRDTPLGQPQPPPSMKAAPAAKKS